MHPQLETIYSHYFNNSGSIPPELSGFMNELSNWLEEQPNKSSSGYSLQTILDNMPFGVTIIGHDKKILHANQAAINTMGYSTQEEIAGHICHDTMCPATVGNCPILDLNQQVDRSERILVRKDKTRIPILKSVTPIILDGEEVLLEAFVDISEQKQLQEEQLC